jgi:hypothetical protein
VLLRQYAFPVWVGWFLATDFVANQTINGVHCFDQHLSRAASPGISSPENTLSWLSQMLCHIEFTAFDCPAVGSELRLNANRGRVERILLSIGQGLVPGAGKATVIDSGENDE